MTAFLAGSSRNVVASIFLDDVLILRLDGTELSEDGDFVGRWIDATGATLRLELHAPGRPINPQEGMRDLAGQSIHRPLEDARAYARLYMLEKGHAGALPEHPTVEVAWSYAQAPILPSSRQGAVAGAARETGRWRASRLPALTPALRASALIWMSNLQAAVAAGDTATVVDAIRYSIEDSAVDSGSELVAHHREMVGLLEAVGPVAELEPIVAADTLMETGGRGRLLDLRRRDGRPLITTQPNADRPFELALRLGMIDGQWCGF